MAPQSSTYSRSESGAVNALEEASARASTRKTKASRAARMVNARGQCWTFIDAFRRSADGDATYRSDIVYGEFVILLEYNAPCYDDRSAICPKLISGR